VAASCDANMNTAPKQSAMPNLLELAKF